MAFNAMVGLPCAIRFTKIPYRITTDKIKQAMSTLRQFSEKERDYWAYQARQDFLRQQGTMEYELDEERKAKLEAQKREQEALTQKQIALSREQAALAELERLKALLAKYNLDA